MAELLLAKSDGTLLLRLELGGRRTLCIGRSPRCDIVVPTPTVSRRHALLYRHPDGWRMVDLGSRNGLHVEEGDRRVVTLQEDRWIRLGAVHFWLIGTDDRLPTPPPVDADLMLSPDKADAPVLSLVDEADRPIQRTALRPALEALLVGSNPSCDIAVDDPTVAPVHMVVYREGRRWCVAPGGDAPRDDRAARAADANASAERASPQAPRSGGESDTILVDGHRTRRRRIHGGMVVRLGALRAIFSGPILPTPDAHAPAVASVIAEWRKSQEERTDHSAPTPGDRHVAPMGEPSIDPVPSGAARAVRAAGTDSRESAAETPDSVISAFLGESAEDDE